MELTRLLRVLRERWRPVALIALIGLVAGFGLTSLSNNDRVERFAVQIPVRFDPEEGETAEDVANRVENAQQLALLATQEVIAENPSAAIIPNADSGRLFFRGEGSSAAEALSVARDLLNAYLTSDSIGGGDLSDDLAALEERAIKVAESLEALASQASPDDQILLSRYELLDQIILALQGQIVSLTVNEALGEASPGSADTIASLQTRLEETIAQRAALPPRPTAELSPAERLQQSALQREFDLLTIEYESLALRSVGVGAAGSPEAPDVSDLTPAPSNPIVNGIVGAIGGTVLAVAAVIFISRSRREVWLADDLPIPVLGEVPLRKISEGPGPSWYDSTFTGGRKEAVQALRTAVDGLLEVDSDALAVAGDKPKDGAIHALAADLAASFASSGRSVLLINADFTTEIEMTEFHVGEPTLGSILGMTAGPQLHDQLARALDDVIFTRADLAVVAAGPAPRSPADALAGTTFRAFVNMARERFDLVVAVAGDPVAASAQVLMQRLGTAIVTATPGESTIPRVNAILGDLHQQRVRLPGAVLLYGSESRVRVRASNRGSTPEIPDAAPSVGRLGSYPFPGSKRMADKAGSLEGLSSDLAGVAPDDAMHDADEISQDRRDVFEPSTDSMRDAESSPPSGGRLFDASPTPEAEDDPNADTELGRQILEALRIADPSRSYEYVARYVVARVEDMLTAVPGQGNISDALIDQVTSFGFIPLSPVKGKRTVGEWFVSEIVDEVGGAVGVQLIEEIASVLAGDRSDPTTVLNQWLRKEFFDRHVARTNREPEVWQLMSSSGEVSLLISARRLTEQRINLIATEVVRRKIDELERERKSAQESGDVDASDRAESRLREAHLFGINLSQLLSTGSTEGRLVYPWRNPETASPIGWHPIWSEGIRPNIAPLQRLGLLPSPVLTDQELDELLYVGSR